MFTAGWVLGLIRQLLIVPRFGETAGVLLEAPFILLAMTVAWSSR